MTTNDPRPLLTLADGTTVRADEVYEWDTTRPLNAIPYPRMAHADGATFHERQGVGWEWTETGLHDTSYWRRVYPPPPAERTRIIAEEMARLPLTSQIAALRPGDECEITWAERGVERRCWARVMRIGRAYVQGRTTFGMVVTAHEHWITSVRPEPNDAIRERWAGRAQ